MNPSILLLQARRADDPMKRQELDCFSRRCGLPEEAFVCHDLLTGPPELGEARRHQALMIGGSGDYLVSQRDLPQFDRLLDFLNEIVELGHPTFASCFGFQCMVEARDGEIVHDPERTEVGTYELTLTEAGRSDPLLGSLPTRFFAQMGRKDRAERLPNGFVNLASSERCPYQAFRVERRPIWGTQFHPELGAEENRERFERYLAKYEVYLSAGKRERVLEEFRESPATAKMLPRFLELTLGYRPTRGQPGQR